MPASKTTAGAEGEPCCIDMKMGATGHSDTLTGRRITARIEPIARLLKEPTTDKQDSE